MFISMFNFFKFINFFLIILLFALFASIFSLQKESLKYSKPFFLIGFRMVFAGVILLIYIFFLKKNIQFIKIKHINLFFYLSIFNIYLTNIFEIWGLDNMSSAKACIIYSLSPFITLIVSYFVFKEILSKKKIYGLMIGFLGLIPIIFHKTHDEFEVGNFFMFSFSELSLILSVFFSVLGWFFLKKTISYGYSFIFVNGVSMFFGGILILLHSFLFEDFLIKTPVSNIKYFFFYTCVMCVISNLICYNLFGYLLRYFSVTFMTFSGLITPFFASFFGWLFLKETISWFFSISIFFFFLGLLMFYNEEKK